MHHNGLHYPVNMTDTKPKTDAGDNCQQSKSATGTTCAKIDTSQTNKNSKENENKASAQGGKLKPGSAGDQMKGQQTREQKIFCKEKKKNREQERYQRKIMNRPENKGVNKPQKTGTPDKNTGEKIAEVPVLSVTIQDDGRTVVEKKEKTVVENKGKNVIEAPETKQGGQAMTEEEKQLEEHQIFRLAKKSTRFPKAKFYCRLCNYHLDSVDLALKHVDESRHRKLKKSKSDQEFLRTLPPASDAHLEALTNLLTTVVNKHKVTQDDLKQRAEILPRVEKVLQKVLPKCQVRLYGSSLSGFGFKDSDVNLEIHMPPGVTPAEILVGTDKAMHKHSDGVFTDVVTDFEGKFPCINFKDKKSGLTCQVGTNSASAVDTSKLLCEYYQLDVRVPVLALALRYWARLCNVDRQADGSMPAYAFVLMVIHFLQRCDPPVVPVLNEKEKLETTNTKSVGELWLDLLKFYVVETPIEELVITIRSRKPINRQDMKIPNKRLAVEDPFALNKKNIAKSVTTSVVFQYIMDRLREALKYFGLPQYTPGKEPTPSNCYSWFVHTKGSSSDNTPSTQVAAGVKTSAQCQCAKATQGTTNTTKCTHCSNNATVNALADSLSEKLVTGHSDTHRTSAGSVQDSSKRHNERTNKSDNKVVNKENANGKNNGQRLGPAVADFNFLFDQELLTGGEKVPLICAGCGAEGHVEKACQDEVLIDLIPLPPMQANFMHRIDMLCMNICEEVKLQRWEIELRESIIWDLQHFIRHHGNSETMLNLFGSSMNGFGFHQSDLDICMTLKGTQDPKSLNFPEIVEKLAKILKKNRDLYGVTPIPTAKVPIVKFVHKPSRLEGDISLYNMLAQVNTRMLYCYSMIDLRVRQLVYAMKIYAKICDIGDASKGSLSSYAYTLMTLFYLQQRKPPVIPVLQELYTGKEKPVAMMEGWNAWFFEDLRNLPRVWKDHGKNRESVGNLWLGLLRFYTEVFDFKKHVITIRQLKPLTRFEKMWSAPSRGFAIEDPFDLDHNLGGGVSRKMATYMMQVLRKTRERFGLPRRFSAFTEDFDYFFDVQFLNDGKPPPNDRGCRICGKIGHFVKDCPRRRPKSSESNDRKKEETKNPSSKQMQDASPKKAAAPKATPNKGPAPPNKVTPTPNKVTPKKEVPEKEILKRDIPQKMPDAGSASQKVGTQASTLTTKSSQVFTTRSATLTPTTKPLLVPSTVTFSPTQVSSQASNKVISEAEGAGKESGEGSRPSSGKQRTNSIGDTWEQHKKTGKKTSKKKKNTATPQSPMQTPPATSQKLQPAAQKASETSLQSGGQKPQTVQPSLQVNSMPSNQKGNGQQTQINSKPNIVPVANTDKVVNQKTPQVLQQRVPQGNQQRTPQLMQPKLPQGMPPKLPQGMPPPFPPGVLPNVPQGMPPQLPQGMQQKVPQGMLQVPQGIPQKVPQRMSQKASQGMPQKAPQGMLQKVPQGMPQKALQGMPQKVPQGMPQKAPQGMPQKAPQGMTQKAPQGMTQKAPQGMPQKAPQGMPQKAPQGVQQRAQPGPRGVQSTQKPVPQTSPTKTPYPNNQKYPQQKADQRTPQQAPQKLPQQTNQKGQQTVSKNLKTPQSDPPVPQLAQPPPTQRHVPFSKKRLPKGPNLTQEQQQEEKKALLQQMTKGLMTMLKQDKEHRRVLNQADPMPHTIIQHRPPPPRTHQGSSIGDASTSRPGAFQQYPAKSPVQKDTSKDTSPKKTSTAPGPARFQSSLPLSHHADPFITQRSPAELGLTSSQYTTQESPQSPSAIGRGQHSPGSVAVNQHRVPGHAADMTAPPATVHQPRYSNFANQDQLKYTEGTQSPVEISQFYVPREEPELPSFRSIHSKNAANMDRSPPGFAGNASDQPQQVPMHLINPAAYQMEHIAFSQGNVGSTEPNTKTSRDFANPGNMMFPQGRSPEEVNAYVQANQPLPIGMSALRRFNSEAQAFNPERQTAAGNQPPSMPTNSQIGMSPAKFSVGGNFDISTWLQFSMSPNSATSQAPMRYPTSNNPQPINMTQFGNLNTSPGTPPYLNYSAPGNPYGSNPSQLVGMPPSPPSNQLHQASPVFGTNNPSQLGVSPSPPNTQLFQGNLFGTPGVIGSPAGAPYTSSPATMHMITNDSGLGLRYGSSTESSVGSQGSVGDRLYREAVTLATTSSTYPAFPQGTASNAAVPTHINIHPKPTVLPYGAPAFAQHQLASMYNNEGQQLVHSEVEGQNVIGQSPR